MYVTETLSHQMFLSMRIIGKLKYVILDQQNNLKKVRKASVTFVQDIIEPPS